MQMIQMLVRGCTNRQKMAGGTVLPMLLVLVFVLAPINSLFGAELRPRILFLASYSPSFHSFFKQIDGFKAGIRENGFRGKDFVLDVEFLDSKRFPISRREQQLVQQLTYKFEKLPPYSLVVTADDTALKFAKKWQATLFQGSKINFLGDRGRPVIVEQGLKRGARRDRGLVFSSSATEQ